MVRKKQYSFLLLVLAAWLVFSCASAADEAVGVSIFYKSGDEKLSGAAFDLYLVAQKDAGGNWKVVAPFDDYPIRLDEDLEELASTLEAYVLRDDPAPSHSGQTNVNGFLRLPRREGTMKHGLYLLVGRPHTQNGKRYTAQPVMLELPYLGADGTTWVYDLLVNIKSESDEEPDVPQTITRRVLKVWDDRGHEHSRPAEITVALLKDGVIAQTVKLNSQNQWRWEWTGLDAHSRWHVVETGVEGYTVSVTQQGITFVITNEYKKPEPTPTPTPTVTPGVTPTPTPKPSQPTLPQTGQLWWPVPVLMCGGLLCLILGLLRRRSDEYEEE